MANTFINATLAVTTSLVTIYTAPALTESICHSLYFSNIDGVASPNVDIVLYDVSKLTEFFIGNNLSIPPGATLYFDKPINLEAGDEIRVSASANGDVEAVASILEIT